MDYPKLYEQLPKDPIKWTVDDIEIWLSFVGLNSLIQKFREISIDGSCLNTITEQDLKNELGIKSGITIKKLMSWISKGLNQYEQFLKSPMAGAKQINYNEIKDVIKKEKVQQEGKQLTKSSHSSTTSDNKIVVPLKKVVSSTQPFSETTSFMEDEENQKRKQLQLIIQQYDGPQNSFYSVKQEGAKIGRHSSNQILILDESISRFHAQIKLQDEVFYLRDTGSTTGTFIKIIGKVLITPEMIIEMGSNQFQAHYHEGFLTLQIIEGPSQGSIIKIPRNNKVTIGRKQTNLFNFSDDQHLSNIHATIFSFENRYYIEDMGTTNGSWKRLSLQGQSSQYEELSSNLVFKFGSSSTYTCLVKTAFICDKTNPNACIICYESSKDCVYMPCKHNTACIKCSKNLKQCPVCRTVIEDFVRIYKE